MFIVLLKYYLAIILKFSWAKNSEKKRKGFELDKVGLGWSQG